MTDVSDADKLLSDLLVRRLALVKELGEAFDDAAAFAKKEAEINVINGQIDRARRLKSHREREK